MQSSSLIFVIVVAIWAIYLLQYWVKRRDHLFTIRSVDRFSAAMRVLDHQRLDDAPAETTPRSYATAPTRAARAATSERRAVAAGGRGAGPASDHRAADEGVPVAGSSAARPARRSLVDRVVDAPRRVRGLTLLAHLVLLPVVLLLTVLGPLPWWTPLVLLIGTVGAFGWLRQGVIAERAAARAQARARRRPAAATSTPAGSTRAVSAPAAAPAARPVPSRRPAAAPVPTATTRRADVPFDGSPAPVAPVTTAPVAEVVTTLEEVGGQPAALAPDTWQPTPVPRPTYTMKARAERPAPAPLPEVMTPVEDDLEALPALDGELLDPGARAVGS